MESRHDDRGWTVAQRTSFEQVIADLDRALALCRNLGLSAEVETSRFVEYRERLQRFVDLRAQPNGIDELLKNDSDTDRMIAGISQVEGLELANLVLFLEKCDPDVLRPKLREVLGGPVVPKDEDQASNQARNFMFELALAWTLERAGLRPTLGERPDLQCEVEGKRLLIECKRPFSGRTVTKRIGEANGTLLGALKKAPPGSRGIIAVSVSRVLNEGSMFLLYSSEKEASRHLADELERMARAEALQRQSPPKIIGVLFHIMTPALHRETQRMDLASQFVFDARARRGTADYRAACRFGETIGAISEHPSGF
jgi:hypothetical protein